MEIRARYILVGLFVLAVIVAAGGFVYWLWGVGGFTERTTYAIRFNGPVNGVSTGSEVVFNGIVIGEVTGLTLDPAKPSDVLATISVDKAAPVRADTHAGLAFSGLTGSARIALTGGSNSAPPVAPGNPPTITADNAELNDITVAARNTLGGIDQLIGDNAADVHTAIANIATFSDALARNSDKIDTIVAGLAKLTGSGASPTYALHDLPAPSPVFTAPLPQAQLVVAMPTAVVALQTQRILLAGPDGDLPVFDTVRWADALPALIQAKTIQSFENAGYGKALLDSSSVASGDFSLTLDLRAFQVASTPHPDAQVAIAAKLLTSDGRVVDSKTFSHDEPIASADDSTAAIAGLSTAYGAVTSAMVSWALGAMVAEEAKSPPPAPSPAAPALNP